MIIGKFYDASRPCRQDACAPDCQLTFINSPYAADEVSRLCRLMCGGASPHREAYARSARRSRQLILSSRTGKAQPFRTSGGKAAPLRKVSY
ncbi:MAG: hypothetical protein H0W45_00135 [Acidobacteria bacterium]|nr:hypothetical protein [Acidobacteriota bacterium]